MFRIIATLVLTLAANSASAFYVLGDSVSAWRQSWPQVMREQYNSWIRSDVQSMRALASYEQSVDLIGIDGHQHLAIMALGFNDGTYYGADADLTSPQQYFQRLHATVTNWRSGRYPFKKVIIVVPPDTPKSTEYHDAMRFQAQLYCALMITHWKQNWLHCVDWNDIGYYDNTMDGVHPRHSFSSEMAAHMYNEIANFAPEAL